MFDTPILFVLNRLHPPPPFPLLSTGPGIYHWYTLDFPFFYCSNYVSEDRFPIMYYQIPNTYTDSTYSFVLFYFMIVIGYQLFYLFIGLALSLPPPFSRFFFGSLLCLELGLLLLFWLSRKQRSDSPVSPLKACGVLYQFIMLQGNWRSSSK